MWQETCKIAKSDETLRLLVKEIVRQNRNGENASGIIGTPYGAFRDRVQEMGLNIPNEAYYGILLSSIAASLK